MDKELVVYFSASGITRRAAEQISGGLKCDLFEIEPTISYTNDDLDWTNRESRSSIEMQDKTSRPSIKNKVSNIDDYGTIILGFPIWWYTAPTIINTFIEENDLNNKKIYVFATSGSSSVDSCIEDLKQTYPHLNFVSAKRFSGYETINELIEWIK